MSAGIRDGRIRAQEVNTSTLPHHSCAFPLPAIISSRKHLPIDESLNQRFSNHRGEVQGEEPAERRARGLSRLKSLVIEMQTLVRVAGTANYSGRLINWLTRCWLRKGCRQARGVLVHVAQRLSRTRYMYHAHGSPTRLSNCTCLDHQTACRNTAARGVSFISGRAAASSFSRLLHLHVVFWWAMMPTKESEAKSKLQPRKLESKMTVIRKKDASAKK